MRGTTAHAASPGLVALCRRRSARSSRGTDTPRSTRCRYRSASRPVIRATGCSLPPCATYSQGSTPGEYVGRGAGLELWRGRSSKSGCLCRSARGQVGASVQLLICLRSVVVHDLAVRSAPLADPEVADAGDDPTVELRAVPGRARSFKRRRLHRLGVTRPVPLSASAE